MFVKKKENYWCVLRLDCNWVEGGMTKVRNEIKWVQWLVSGWL